MMAYIDYEEYLDYTADSETGREEIEGLLEAASRLVDALCLGRIGGEPERLGERVHEAVRLAAAEQARYLARNGGIDAAVSGAADYSGNIRIGSFSYGDGRLRDQSERTLIDSRFCRAAVDVLRPTGLLDAGCGR